MKEWIYRTCMAIYEMAKIAEGKMFLTFADDLIINTKNWDTIYLKKLEIFKDNIFISYTSHNKLIMIGH